MSSKVRKFHQGRMAEGGGPSSNLSLGEIENMFVKKLTEKINLVERDITRTFKRFDKDNSGYLDATELAGAIHLYLNGVNRSQVSELVSHYDVDGDGKISLDEFTSFLISRSSEDKSSWQTVDSLIAKNQSRGGRTGKRGKDMPESIFETASYGDGISALGDMSLDGSKENDDANTVVQQQSSSHKSSVFLHNVKALLLKRATELRQEGKIPIHQRLGNHLAPLTESTARTILSKAFLPYLHKGDGLRVDMPSFARVLSKFTYPGSPPPRKDVVSFLFKLCCEGKERADPDLLVDMIFDKGGIRINRWGFAQQVQAPTDTGRPAVGKGPFVRREGDVPAKVSDVPYRVSTPHSHTALAAPSDFDPLLIERSFTPPAVQVSRDFVYGKSMNLYSGEPVVYLPHSPQEVVYAAASLVVIHDLKNNTQVYFEGHDDDITCFSLSPCGSLCASGQVGHAPELLVWETALDASGEIITPVNEVVVLDRKRGARRGMPPVGLVARIGKGFFSRGVCAASFSHDNAYVVAVGCDDKHNMGVWSLFSGELQASFPTAPGIPPQIRALSFSPMGMQDTGFVERSHEESDCDLICTAGEHNFLRFWSFKRPNKQGVGAALMGRGHTTGRKMEVPRTHTQLCFVPREGDEDPVGPQFDVITAGDNGNVYLWREAICIRASRAMASGGSIRSMQYDQEQGLLYLGGGKGAVAVLDAVSLEVLATLSATGSELPSGSGPLPVGMTAAGAAAAREAPPSPKRVKDRPPSHERGTRAPGARPAAHHPMAGKASAAASRAPEPARMDGGIFSQKALKQANVKRVPTAEQLKTRTKWTGPAIDKIIAPLGGGVKSSADVIGMAIVRAYAQGDEGEGEEGGEEESYLMCTTGHGKIVRFSLPNRHPRRGLQISAAPQVMSYFHFAPLYGLESAPLGMTFAKDASIFVTGGDDCWLCMWNADTKKLVVRTRCKAPIRSISVHPNGQLLMVGMVGGGVALYACDTSNTAAKAVKSAGKSAGAFQRATEFIYEVTLTERAARRDCIEDISDVKFSPNGKMVAVASHDGFIDIYAVRFKLGDLQTPHSDFSLKYMKRLRGHSSFVVHLDWSEDNRLLQSTCGAHELLYWDVAQGRQMLSSQDCVEGDTKWQTSTCDLGFSVMGIWAPGQDGTDINTVHVRPSKLDTGRCGGIVATGDDFGKLKFFNYPCVVRNAPAVTCKGHSSHVMTCKWLDGEEGDKESLIGTTGGNDCCAIVWRVQ